MPSAKKILHFLSSAWATSVSIGVLGFGMSAEWSKTTMSCSRPGVELFNGTAVVTLELFHGNSERSSCPSFGASESFEVIPVLVNIGTTTPLVLHALVVCLLVLCLLFSALSILISVYNSVSNPYETYMGPIGIYTCSSLSACLSVLGLIIFALNVMLTDMVEDLVKNYSQVELKDKRSEMQLGYYMVIPYAALSLLAVALIYMYDHAAYTHRREQQRPTEDAPKEIMMY